MGQQVCEWPGWASETKEKALGTMAEKKWPLSLLDFSQGSGRLDSADFHPAPSYAELSQEVDCSYALEEFIVFIYPHLSENRWEAKAALPRLSCNQVPGTDQVPSDQMSACDVQQGE